jgi:phage baseplate assembly protein W
MEDHIKESLRALLLMQPGERLLHPELGCGLAKFLFRPLTEGLKRDIGTQISEAVAHQEPRIQLLNVQVEGDKTEKSRLLVLLEYRILQSQRIDSLKVALQP